MFVSSIPIFAASFCFVITTTAFFNNDHEHYWSSAPRPPIPQFQSWYPKHSKKLINFTHTTCNASYADYLTEYNSPRQDVSYLLDTCYSLESCILRSVSSDWQANYNSANIILGLMPTLLSSIGPSFAEISLLSSHRPLLSFLISMGASAIWPNRIFEYIHPTEALSQGRRSLRTSKMHPWPAAMLSLGQYIVAVGAMVNVMTTSIGVGRNSILAFGCTTTFAPLLWSTLPSAIHLVSVISYLIARKVALRRTSTEQLPQEVESSETQENPDQTQSKNIQAATSRTPQRRFHRVCLSWFRDAWLSEFTICANHKPHDCQDKTAVPRISILLAVAAGLMNFCHVTFGVIIFSSLQLISVEDTFKEILWRYIVSSTACRLLLIIEMSGLRANIEADGPADDKVSYSRNSQERV